MHKLIVINMIVIISVLLVACGSATAPAASTSSTPVNIKVETNPNPTVTGDAELILNITDGNGDPIEGATVDVSAEHTGHGGMAMNGVATEQGAGKYAINTNFSMSGVWKLTVYVRKEGLDYKQEIEIPVE
ncbi:MAG: FixH family protein [Anaerolineales bacterium]